MAHEYEYEYEALTASGAKVADKISAENEAEAKTRLLNKGLMVTKISMAGGSFSLMRFFPSRVTSTELILFTKQFRTLFSAGIPVVEVFSILQEQTQNRSFRLVIENMYGRIIEGQSLRDAFTAHPEVFSPLYCSMITAGESSGSMSEVLDRLCYILAREEKVKQQVQGALRYPKIVMIVIFGAFLVLLNFVIPQFAGLYSSAKVELPLPTQVAIMLNHFCEEYWWVALGGGLIAWYATRGWLKTDKGMLWRDTMGLKIPVIGGLTQKSVLSRFAAIFSILQRSGVSILASMDILKLTVNNTYFQQQFEEVKEKLRSGRSVAEAIGGIKGFSPLAISLVTVGERSGNIESMMDELSTHYEEEVSMQVDRMTELIGPVLILCLGVVVLFFALAIFMPMWDMVKFV